MGSQQSTVAINSLNARITDIATKTVTTCNSRSTQVQNQNVTVGGIFSAGTTVTANQDVQFNIQCLQDDALVQKLQSDVADAIAATTDASGVSVLPAFGNSISEQQYNLKNIIHTTISKQNIINTYNTLDQEQNQTVNLRTLFQFWTTVSAQQSAALLANTINKLLTDSGVISRVETQIQAKSTATSANPLDFIAKTVNALFGGISSIFSISAPVLIVIAVAVIVFLMYFSRSASGYALSSSAGKALESRANPVGTLKGAPKEEMASK